MFDISINKTNYYTRSKLMDYTLHCIEQSMQRKINYLFSIKWNKYII
jgi:hypothetical protein